MLFLLNDIGKYYFICDIIFVLIIYLIFICFIFDDFIFFLKV